MTKRICSGETVIRNRCHAAGIHGEIGGWIRLPIKPAPKNIQGWFAVYAWAKSVTDGPLPANLREILDCKRVGIPTLSRTDRQELAVGIMSHLPVSWRD